MVRVSGHDAEDEPVVYCDWDGKWWAGRFIGSLSFEGRRLTIKPRFGLTTLRKWLFEAMSVVVTNTPGKLQDDDAFIVQLLASVWVHGFIEAAKHGLPLLRRDVSTKGATIRGRLDVAASIRMMAANSGQVISIRSERSLDHAASDAIIAAYQVLRRGLSVSDDQWMPIRARELIPQILSVTGARPRVPTKAELDQIRYTPITASFSRIAELSRQIAGRRGLAADVDASGDTKGVLLDVAELWEIFVLKVLRKAAAPLNVVHGTRENTANKHMLRSDVTGQVFGKLIPDAILYDGEEVVAVADAKYKSLHPSASAPHGPKREDLYQMGAYLGQFLQASRERSLGLLLYPSDPNRPTVPIAEFASPWSLDRYKKIAFLTLPHDEAEAVAKLRTNLIQMGVYPDNWPGWQIRSKSTFNGHR